MIRGKWEMRSEKSKTICEKWVVRNEKCDMGNANCVHFLIKDSLKWFFYEQILSTRFVFFKELIYRPDSSYSNTRYFSFFRPAPPPRLPLATHPPIATYLIKSAYKTRIYSWGQYFSTYCLRICNRIWILKYYISLGLSKEKTWVETPASRW